VASARASPMTPPRYRYRHFGLTVEANVALPARAETGLGPADVLVEVTRARERPQVDPPWLAVGEQAGVWRAPVDSGSRLRLQFASAEDSWADFLIGDRGESVRLTLADSADLDDACELLMASVFSCVLVQRGLTCLHASVVSIEDRAIALVGHKGAGKSTLALALARAGGRLVSDDVAAVSMRDGVWGVAVGRPALRMRPDSAASLARGLAAQRPVWLSAPPGMVKRYYSVDENTQDPARSWLALTGVFLLAPRGGTAAPRFRVIGPGELLPALLANRHMAAVLDSAAQRRDFTLLGALVGQVPGRELRRPDDLGTTEAVAEAVMVEAGRLPRSPTGWSQPV
jgi:hypothetical protein